MDFGIAGKVALVVGGSKGIGLESARMLAAEGCRVAVVARTQHHIDRAVGGIREAGGEAVGIAADMSTQDGIERAVAETNALLGAPLIVVTQADFHVRGFFEEVTRYEDYVDSFRAYTMSQVYMLHAVLPAMKEVGWGRFVHIGSATAKEPQDKPPHTVANGTPAIDRRPAEERRRRVRPLRHHDQHRRTGLDRDEDDELVPDDPRRAH